MITTPNRIKVEIFTMVGKFQAESKYVRTSYYDTEQQPLDKHKEIIKAYRECLKHGGN